MHYPASSPSLFAQLQSRFPTSSLVTELVQYQDGQYVVRALVQVAGTVLLTAMAAAPTIEQAEDQARVRVLKALGITPDAGMTALPDIPSLMNKPSIPNSVEREYATPSVQTSPGERPTAGDPPILPAYKLETVSPSANNHSLDYSEPLVEEIEGASEEFGNFYDEGEGYDAEEFAPAIAEPDSPPASNGAIAAPERPIPARSEPAIAPESEEPEDLSSLIALTDIEMDRIGWTKQEGRDYLKRTYKKSTRQKLDVGELMDFLNYLRALPSVNGL